LLAQPTVALPASGDVAQRTQQSSGCGTVSGIVLNDVTGQPLHRAVAILKPLDADSVPQIATTTETGAFEFAMVPAGRYTFVVQRDGYLSVGAGGPQSDGPPSSSRSR
jgi:hypothetical protein